MNGWLSQRYRIMSEGSLNSSISHYGNDTEREINDELF